MERREKRLFDYPKFHLTMHCYLCEVKSGQLKLIEHKDACWVKPEELDTIDWLPADLDLIEEIKKIQL